MRVANSRKKITFFSPFRDRTSFILCEEIKCRISSAAGTITHNSIAALACRCNLILKAHTRYAPRFALRQIVYAIRRYFFFHGPHGGRAGDDGGRRGRDAREEPSCRRARPDEANVAFLLKGVGSQFALLAYLRGLGATTLRPVVGGGPTVQNDLMNGIFHSGLSNHSGHLLLAVSHLLSQLALLAIPSPIFPSSPPPLPSPPVH